MHPQATSYHCKWHRKTLRQVAVSPGKNTLLRMCSSNTSNLGFQHVRCSLHVGMGQNEAFGGDHHGGNPTLGIIGIPLILKLAIMLNNYSIILMEKSHFLMGKLQFLMGKFLTSWKTSNLGISLVPQLDPKMVGTSCVFMDKPVKMSQVLVLVPENNWSRVTSKKLLSRYRMIEIDRRYRS